MSTSLQDPAADELAAAEDLTPAEPELQLEMTVTKPSACLRAVVVSIPRSEIDRYLQKEYDGLVGDAQVPGFRPVAPPASWSKSSSRSVSTTGSKAPC